MKQMNPRERLQAAAHREKVDRAPCVCPGGMMNMIVQEIMQKSRCLWPEAHSDALKMAELTYALHEAGGFENYGVPFCLTVEAEAMGAQVNMGNLNCEPHVVDPLLLSSEQIDMLKPLQIDSGRVKIVLEAIEILREKDTGVPIIGNLGGPVSVAGTLLDMSILLRELRKKPESVEKLLDFISDNLIVFGKAQIAAGADAVCISEPSGTGEILGPKHFERYAVKYINKVLDALDASVKMVHICGHLRSVYHALPQIHCDVFSFDAMVPIREIKEHMPDRALMGNVNTHALWTMPPEKIVTLVKFALQNGIDILAPACGLPITTPLLNIQTMVRYNQNTV